MKKDIKKLVEEVFRDEKFFEALGFNEKESMLLNLLIKGENLSNIAVQLNLSYSVLSGMKSRALYLLPIYIHRKLKVVNTSDFKLINAQFKELNYSINKYLKELGQEQVYEIKELRLTKRTLNSLAASNIKNTKELMAIKKGELLQIKNLGAQGVLEIELELRRLGLLG